MIFPVVCVFPEVRPLETKETWLPQMLPRLLAPAPEDRFSSAAEALSFLKDEPQVLAARPEVHPFPADVVGTWWVFLLVDDVTTLMSRYLKGPVV